MIQAHNPMIIGDSKNVAVTFQSGPKIVSLALDNSAGRMETLRRGSILLMVENESGNSEFDYDGKKTPEDKTDDCTLPSEGKAATDFAWKLKGAAMGKTQAILQKQLANAEEMGEPEDLGGIIEQLWTGTYQKSREEGGLREAIRKIIVDTILG